MPFRFYSFLCCLFFSLNLISCTRLAVNGDDDEVSPYYANARVKAAISITNNLREINSLNAYPQSGVIEEGTGYPKEFVRKKIDRLIEQLHDSQDIGLMAKVSWNFHMNSGEKLSYLYEYAFWHCVHLLVVRTDEESTALLYTLKDHYANDGHPSEDMDVAIKRHEATFQNQNR